MLMSMTGFGKITGSFESKKVSIEIRSLNSKSLDLNVRIASNYRELESEVRKIVGELLDRGKIDVYINMDSTGDVKNFTLNKDLAAAYFEDLKEVNALINGSTEDYLSLILRMPDIYNNEREELTDAEKAWLLQLVKDACEKLNEFRRQEGNALVQEFTFRIEDIRRLLLEVPKYESERLDTVRDRMRKGLEELQNGKIDENRLEQELIFYIEKLDVSEEKMRLMNHLDYYLDTMKVPMSGKKLGFISQEIGREINTLGSKSNHAEMQKLVVDMKDNLEKIKEQILNTL
ncbi:MAG: YicC family protein [Crocinitomicaceae bacterium]|nr:YicC family protein [Crocinitomicaceae bacterium]